MIDISLSHYKSQILIKSILFIGKIISYLLVKEEEISD